MDNPKPYLNDNWTNAIHGLGPSHLQFAKEVRQLIVEAPTPFALTIGGRWGSGKSSMLRALMEGLGGNPANLLSQFAIEKTNRLKFDDNFLNESSRKVIKTVWFNPWQYQNESNPLIPLLHEIREQIRNHYLKSKLDETASIAVEAGVRILGHLLDDVAHVILGARFSTTGGKVVEAVEKAGDNWRKNTFSGLVEAQRFHLEFENAIKHVVTPENLVDEETLRSARLVIFIDDLDRCSDKAVFSLLEAIRLYLTSRYCVFVFGLDRAHVESAVARAIGDTGQNEAAMYVDKMFQVKLHPPPPDLDGLTNFIAGMLERMNLTLMSGCTPAELARLLPPNPRFIKNFLNGLAFHGRLFNANATDTPTLVSLEMILVHYLRVIFPDAYELLALGQDGVMLDLIKVFDDVTDTPRRQYLHHVIENPLISEISTKDAISGERFRQIRSGAWRSVAMDNFKTKFAETFGSKVDPEFAPDTSSTTTTKKHEKQQSDLDPVKPYILMVNKL